MSFDFPSRQHSSARTYEPTRYIVEIHTCQIWQSCGKYFILQKNKKTFINKFKANKKLGGAYNKIYDMTHEVKVISINMQQPQEKTMDIVFPIHQLQQQET